MRRTPEALRACQNHQEKPLGLRGCVVCVMWCDVGGGVGVGLVKVCIFHNQKMHVYLI